MCLKRLSGFFQQKHAMPNIWKPTIVENGDWKQYKWKIKIKREKSERQMIKKKHIIIGKLQTGKKLIPSYLYSNKNKIDDIFFKKNTFY